MTTSTAAAALARVAVVNGPEGNDLDWHNIDWRQVEDDVRRLRQRIFTATQAGDLKRVRSLQKLMLRSRANTLLSVRRVTEINSTLAARPRAWTGRWSCPRRRKRNWSIGCSIQPNRGRPARSSGCISREGAQQGNSARSAFPSSLIACCKLAWSTRWNPSGKPDSSRGPTGSCVPHEEGA